MVCARLEFDDMQCLGGTCRALCHTERRYRSVALLQWGHDFWRDALRRPTRRSFVSWQEELRALHLINRHCDHWSMPRWDEGTIRAFWRHDRR